MSRRGHTSEQVVRKLREADRLLGEGLELPEVAGGLEGAAKRVLTKLTCMLRERVCDIGLGGLALRLARCGRLRAWV
jgi:hypothetical protein